MTLQTHTVTVEIAAPREQVFRYVADLDNVPEWATGFARQFEREGAMARVMTPGGPAELRIEADAESCVVDFLVSPAPGVTLAFPSRVIGLPDGRSAYAFTIFPEPGQDEAAFSQATRALEEELENVARLAPQAGP